MINCRITTEDKEKWRREIDAYKRLLKRTTLLTPASRWEDEAVQRALSADPAYRELLERPDILRVYFGKYLAHLEKKKMLDNNRRPSPSRKRHY